MSATSRTLSRLGDLVALHRGLQRADRVDLGDDDASALAAQRLGAALAHVAVAADDRDLAGDEDVGRAVEAVDDGVAAAVLVVELGLGDRVVDVDRREEQVAGAGQLVEAEHAGRGLLGDALDLGRRPWSTSVGSAASVLRTSSLKTPTSSESVVVGGGHLTGGLPRATLVDEHRGVATVVEDHVGALATGPGEDLLGALPVLGEGLALPGEDGHTLQVLGRALGADDDGGGGLVLGGVDVAGGPADLGTERGERLDEHGGLHGHVQRAGDAGALERLGRPELLAQAHQAGHLVLGKADLVTAGLGEAQVGNLVVKGHAKSLPLSVLVRGPGAAHLGVHVRAGYHPRRRPPLYRLHTVDMDVHVARSSVGWAGSRRGAEPIDDERIVAVHLHRGVRRVRTERGGGAAPGVEDEPADAVPVPELADRVGILVRDGALVQCIELLVVVGLPPRAVPVAPRQRKLRR